MDDATDLSDPNHGASVSVIYPDVGSKCRAPAKRKARRSIVPLCQSPISSRIVLKSCFDQIGCLFGAWQSEAVRLATREFQIYSAVGRLTELSRFAFINVASLSLASTVPLPLSSKLRVSEGPIEAGDRGERVETESE